MNDREYDYQKWSNVFYSDKCLQPPEGPLEWENGCITTCHYDGEVIKIKIHDPSNSNGGSVPTCTTWSTQAIELAH
jgi:hypothetical protein